MTAHKPFSWYGGKSVLAPLLVSLLPIHETYVEVFGGSGAVLFAKPLSNIEIFNDLDSGVYNFFRVLRTSEQVERLQDLLFLTQYSYEEYYACLATWEQEQDPVEKARQWYVGVMQSMNSSIRNTGWSHTKLPNSNPARSWLGNVTRFDTFRDRLARVQIDHRDFEAIIASYDGPETCFYLDPPYHPETRQKRDRCYQHEMTARDHERLLFCLKNIQGMVVLSGYAHPTYERALREWECIQVAHFASSAVRPDGGAASESWQRTECIWRNPACVRRSQRVEQPSLFGDEQPIVVPTEEKGKAS